MNDNQQRFNQLIIEAIDEVLGYFGEPVRNQLYIRLEDEYSIRKSDIPSEIEEFMKFLYRIFNVNARLIEIKFMKKLYAKVNDELNHLGNHTIIFSENNLSFLTYIAKFKESYLI